MNITIVTWAGVNNYGTSLQSFALQKALEKKGYKVRLLDRFKLASPLQNILSSIKTLLKRRKRLSEKQQRMHSFHSQFQNIIKPATQGHLSKLVETTDLFISGSDQIWNTSHRYDPAMFLSFADGKKRISYASSIGTNEVPLQYREVVREHLLKYDHIAVRERTAVDALAKLTGRKDIVQVLDPTFLLTENDWREFAGHAKLNDKISEPYILCYFIGQNDHYKQQLQKVIETSGCKSVVIVTLKEQLLFTVEGAKVINYASPTEFVYLIQHASLVCTDSFHATAIAINSSVNFVEFLRFKEVDENSQNSRIYDILSHYGLGFKLFNWDNDDWIKDVDYSSVFQMLNQDRKDSWDYLINAIEK